MRNTKNIGFERGELDSTPNTGEKETSRERQERGDNIPSSMCPKLFLAG